MFNIFSLIFKYIFIIIIYMFIFSIIRLIYLDIKGINLTPTGDFAYLKLLNRKDTLPFKIDEYYSIKNVLSLGRSGGNDIIIKDPYISKKHFKIVEDEKEFFIEDLGSANGTFINDERIEDVVKLNNGDRIKISNIEFIFVNR
ncbi:FHA domain-containing protein [Wansuia hejianensis]|uniref:FHA domain-containing protein n=1 Tax=Wansuia hejianensis TaxID=2763667 RepID=A0A926EXU1_9FIRM|nr:FHA domain-containing protein [Wansuia hejianensis]MBC8589551.1 FHA domain-containing protein [Wansuia hejianensis]